MKEKLAILVTAVGVVVAAWGGDSGDEQQMTPPSRTAVDGLGSYNPSSALVVEGREQLRACVEVLDNVAAAGVATRAIERAFGAAQTNAAWPTEFGSPVVDSGCPMVPAALSSSGDFPDEAPCLATASPYLVYVFVADPGSLGDRFPPGLIQETKGIRKAVQERILGSEGCLGDVSEAWYLTPDELANEELLQRFIFGPLGIFTIADFQAE